MAEGPVLTEGEQVGIVVTEEDVGEARDHGAYCLVGKLWMDKKTNKEAFRSVLARIWRAEGRVSFKELQDNLWIFEFSDVETKLRVLEERPWSFDRQILVLHDFDGFTLPFQMEFTHSSWWIQVHDMPLLCMTKAVGSKIGESMGSLEEVDVASNGVGWGRYLRIRVILDLTNPLERGRVLQFGGKSMWVSFRYEQLPLFCFHCGRIIHGGKGCPVPQSRRMNQVEEVKPWGVRLRAEDPRKGNGGEHIKPVKLPGRGILPSTETDEPAGRRRRQGAVLPETLEAEDLLKRKEAESISFLNKNSDKRAKPAQILRNLKEQTTGRFSNDAVTYRAAKNLGFGRRVQKDRESTQRGKNKEDTYEFKAKEGPRNTGGGCYKQKGKTQDIKRPREDKKGRA